MGEVTTNFLKTKGIYSSCSFSFCYNYKVTTQLYSLKSIDEVGK